MPQLDQLRELLARLDTRARMVIGGALILCVVGIVAFTRFQAEAGYAPLYSALSTEDAGQIVEKLRAQKVPYRLGDGGRAVLVPESEVYELRLSLAREGLPTSGQLGFELFDRSGLPGTQFSNRVNYQRALQGELARTIGSMAEVSQARVHLVLPEENLFSEQTKATASVVLTLRPGAAITPEMTSAIARVIASATPGVSAEEVTIADNTGRLLRGPDTDQLGGLSAGQLEIQRQYEDRLAGRLQTMLDSVVGASQSVVRVQAQFDFDSEEIKRETVTPVGGGKGLVSTEKVREEQYSGAGGGGGRGGVAGLGANLGTGAVAGTPGGAYINRDETRQYEFSRQTSQLKKAPGKLKSVTIAAVLDEALPSAAEQKVRDVLSAAAGVNAERGDVITVTRMKMKTAELAAGEEKAAVAAEKRDNQRRLLNTVLRHGLSLAAAGLIFVSILMAVRQLRPPLLALAGDGHVAVANAGAEAAPASPAGAASGATLVTDAAMVTVASAPVSAAGHVAPALTLHTSADMGARVRDELRDLAREDTPAVADRLRSLLQESGA